MPIVGASSFMLREEDEHLNGRRAALPALQRRAIHRDADWMLELVQRTISSWPRGVSVVLHPRLRALTLEVILRRIFTWREHGSEDRLRVLGDWVLAMLAVTGSVVFPVPMLRYGPGRRIWERFLLQRSEADELIYALIEERHQTAGVGREDALAVLLAARDCDGTPMTQVQLRDNVMSFILAGHETTASQLAWAFQLLAHNPRAQERLIEEIDGDTGDEYLTATIQEVLRHRPVFLFAIPRAVKQPIELGGRRYEPPTHLLGLHLSAAPRPADISRSGGVPSRAVFGRTAEPPGLVAVGRRSQALSGIPSGHGGDEDRAANSARKCNRQPREPAHGASAVAERDRDAARRFARGVAWARARPWGRHGDRKGMAGVCRARIDDAHLVEHGL